MNRKTDTVFSSFEKAANKKTDINPNGVQITKTDSISQNISAALKGPKEKYRLHKVVIKMVSYGTSCSSPGTKLIGVQPSEL